MIDKEIIFLIKEGKATKAFEEIYRNFPVVRKMIVSSGGTIDDAKDIFQDSILVFYRLSLRPDFSMTSSIATLIYGISKKMWLKKIRDVKSRELSLTFVNENLTELEGLDDCMEESEKVKLVEQMLSELGDPCRSLLEKFYFEKNSMKEIAQEMGYSNEKTAKAQKYKCIERGKKILGEKILLLKTLFQ